MFGYLMLLAILAGLMLGWWIGYCKLGPWMESKGWVKRSGS